MTNPYTLVRVRVIMRIILNSHSQSDFSERNDEPLVKPNPLRQLKAGASKKTKQQALQWKTSKPSDAILKDIPFTGNPLLGSLQLQKPLRGYCKGRSHYAYR